MRGIEKRRRERRGEIDNIRRGRERNAERD
jgi:hypothetical protein